MHNPGARIKNMRYNYQLRVGSSHIRPDIVLDVKSPGCSAWGVVIEVDEFAHYRYNIEGELRRMKELQNALVVPVKFLRFNPDPTEADTRTLDQRLPFLLDAIKQSLSAEPKKTLEVTYVMYD